MNRQANVLVVVAVFTLVCVLANDEAAAQAITVTPSNPTISVGQTQQFTATGTYGDSSKPVPATNLIWCVGTSNGNCNGNIASVASVSSSGVAKCLPGATGAATILAGSGTPAGVPDIGFPLRVFGSAQLTCP